MSEGKQTNQPQGPSTSSTSRSKPAKPQTFTPMNDAALTAVERSASQKDRQLLRRLVENVRFHKSRAEGLARRVERLEAAGRELRTAEEVIDAMPPSDASAEIAVLGSCLLVNAHLPLVRKLLKPDDFYQDDLRLIFVAMCELEDQWSGIDSVTLVAKLKELGTYDAIGGAYRISEIINGCPTAANVAFYSRIVSLLSTRRRLQSLGIELMAAALDLTRKPADIIREAMERLQ